MLVNFPTPADPTKSDPESEVEMLRRDNATLRERIRQLEEQIAHLEEKLKINSSNSSKPPSSDRQKKKKLKPLGNPAKRNRGGQPGHEGKNRSLLPVTEVDQEIPCPPPDRCVCGGSIEVTSENPYRHQVFEIPKVKPLVTEYQLQWGKCLCCGSGYQGKLPLGVPSGILGSRAMAINALLTGGEYGLSKEKSSHLLRDGFGLEVSVASVSKSEKTASEALKEPVEEAQEYVREQPIVNADETSFKQGNGDGMNPTGKKAWMWVAVAPLVTVFLVLFGRGTEAAKNLLGETFAGVVGSDRWSAYNWVNLYFRQLCWSHLLREFQKIAERSGESKEIGENLLGAGREVFHYWHRVRDGTLKHSSFKLYAHCIRGHVVGYLEEGAAYEAKKGDKSERAKTARTCQSLLKVEPAMWTFVRKEGVEPTNNSSERALRPAVLWRKRNYGTQSERGSRFIERMMTVSATCRQQNRNVLDYLTDAIEAYLRGEKAPSLLPDRARVGSDDALTSVAA